MKRKLNKLKKLQDRIDELEDFIADMVICKYMSNFNILQLIVRDDSKRKKLWKELKDKKYSIVK